MDSTDIKKIVDNHEGRLHYLELSQIDFDVVYQKVQEMIDKATMPFPETLKPHVDWTPKDLYGLRKEVERFEFTLKALKATITDHIQASISKRKHKY